MKNIGYSIYKAYEYAFYKFYDWLYNPNSKDDLPHIRAIGLLSVLTIFNLYSCLVLIEVVTGAKLTAFTSFSKLGIAVIVAPYCAVHYAFLLHGDRYKNIIAEFQDEDAQKKKIGSIQVTLYIILTIIIFISSAIIK